MANKKITIEVDSTADTQGLDQARKRIGELHDAADSFIRDLQQGVGIDLGGRIVSAFAELPRVFEDILRRGIDFNASMGDAEIGIANVLAKFQNLDKEAAQKEAAKAMEAIIELEPKAAATLDQLVQGFMATAASAQSAKISVADNIDLVGKFSNALANANLPAEQLSQEMRAIFTGNITPDAALAKILSITNEDVEKAKQLGNLYQFLNDKLGTLGQAGDSAAVKFSTLTSTIDKAVGQLAKPVFDTLLVAIQQLNDQMSKPEFVDALRDAGYEIGQIVKVGAEFLVWASKNAEILTQLALSAGAVGTAIAAIQIKNVVAGLLLKAAAWERNAAAVGAETAAIAANTIAQNANAAARAANVAASGVPTGAAVGRGGLAALGRGALALAGGPTGLLLGAGALGFEKLMSSAAKMEADAAAATAATLKRIEKIKELREVILRAGGAAEKEAARLKLDDAMKEDWGDFSQIIQSLSDNFDQLAGSQEKAIGDGTEFLMLLEKQRKEAQQLADASKLTAEQIAKQTAELNRRIDSSALPRRAMLDNDLRAARARLGEQMPRLAGLSVGDLRVQSRLRDPNKTEEEWIKVKEAIAQVIELEKELSDLEKDRKDRATDDNAEEMIADAMDRARLDTESRDAAVKRWETEMAILRARASGNEQLAKQLEKERQIATLTEQIKRDQFISDDAARAKAAEQVRLQELAERVRPQTPIDLAPREGRIGSRGGRVLDAGGRDITGSAFDPETGFRVAAPRPQTNFADALAPRLAAALTPTSDPSKQGKDAGAQVADSAKKASDSIQATADKMSEGIGTTAESVDNLGKETVAAIDALEKTLSGTLGAINKRLAVVEGQLQRLKTI